MLRDQIEEMYREVVKVLTLPGRHANHASCRSLGQFAPPPSSFMWQDWSGPA
jgi:hypothetical protein